MSGWSASGTKSGRPSAREHRARPRPRSQAALQVRRFPARGFLGHGRPGHRLLRAVPAVLRPGAGRIPPSPRPARRSDGRGAVRHARLLGRVPRPCTVRRLDRDLYPDAKDRPDQRNVRVRGLPGRRRRADGDCHASACAGRPRRAPRQDDSRLVPGCDPRVRGRRLRDRARVSGSNSSYYAGALEAVERIVNRGGNAHDVLRATLEALRSRGISPAQLQLAGKDSLVDGLAMDEDADVIIAPVVYRGSEVGSLELAADRVFVERVATLISPYVVRLETGGG